MFTCCWFIICMLPPMPGWLPAMLPIMLLFPIWATLWFGIMPGPAEPMLLAILLGLPSLNLWEAAALSLGSPS